MRMRGCPATGRMAHVFDKVTHRCKCGRWERGFKPATEPVRDRAECQICERKQALDVSGHLMHHGYKRPGYGFIQGDCLGVGHRPYPATDALVDYLELVRSYIGRFQRRLAQLPKLLEIEHHYTVYVNHKKETRTRLIKKGETYHYDHEARTSFPAFDDVIKLEIVKTENELVFAMKDEVRVVARIKKASEPHE